MSSRTLIREVLVPVTKEERHEVEQELERILESAPFKGSRRYPALLRHVVEKTLRGEVDDLKERILGIEVFQRPSGYDTAADPVVRFSAGEVRRRIAQFYQELSGESTIEIRLPVGGYIPQFFRVEVQEGVSSEHSDESHPVVHSSPYPDEDIPFFHPEPENEEDIPLAAAHMPHGSLHLADEPARNDSHIGDEPMHNDRRHRIVTWLEGIIVGALATVIGFTVSPIMVARHKAKTSIMEVWGPLLSNPNMVLISAGHTHWDNNQPPEPQNATVEQHILRPDARISLAAVQTISEVAGFLQTQHKQFRIQEAVSTGLDDFHDRSVILVAGYNNSWTLRLLKPLRFHLTQAGSFRYIEDAENPANHSWGVDFDKPYLQQTADYAIVGRFFDPSTNGPVAVIAGISSTGTSGGGEFMVSPEALNQLSHLAPHGSLNQNFEAVIKVEVVAGSPGAVTILATNFW